jgi:ParB/RepB/Spo0J family partition protein
VDWNENGRAFPYTKNDIKDLLGDFEAGRGIQTPLTAKPYEDEEGKKGLKLVAGYRRLYAALEFSKDHPEFQVPVVLEKPEGDLATLILNIRENVARKDLSHIDLGHDAQRLVGLGQSKEQAAEILGVSPAQVGTHIQMVTELDEDTQLLIHEGRLTGADALDILKLPADERKAFIAEHIAEKEAAKESGGKVKSVREKAREKGANVGSVKLSEFKRYLEDVIETDGPGSNKGQVEISKSLLEYFAGKLTQKQLDNRFEKFCRVKGA